MSYSDLQKIIDLVQPRKKEIDVKIMEAGSEKCVDCDVAMGTYQNEWTLDCPQCKKSIPKPSESISQSTMEGLNNFGAKRWYMQYNTDNSYGRKKKFLDKLLDLNDNCTFFKLPEFVIEEAVDLYIETKFASRGNSLDGIFGGCIKSKCNEHGCSKTNAQIAILLKIEESKITNGIIMLKSKEHLEFFFENVASNFIEGFLIDYKIDVTYKKFTCDLYDRIYKKKISKITDKYMETICIGCVYLLSVMIGQPVKHSTVTKFKPSITKSTYISVYKAILANKKKLHKVFDINNIPYPVSWGVK